MHRIKEKDRILDKLQGWIGLLYLVMMSGILVICILFSDSDIKFLEKVNYLPPLLLLAFGVVFVLGLFQLCRNTVLPEKHKVCLFFIVSFGLFLFQVYSVYNYYFYTGWDVPQLINMSYAVAHGEDVLGFSGYFSQYPNNLFLVSVFSFIRKAAHLVGLHEHEYFVILCVQCLLNTGAGMLLAGVLDELFHKEQIVMSGYVLYLALVWASPWVSIPYSDSMGLIFPVLIIQFYLISNPEPLKTPAFSAFSGPRPCPFPLFFPSREKIRESFFIRPLPLCRAALRKSAWLLLWRGRKCSSWYLHLRVREVPAHPWVRLRWIRDCWYMYVSTDGNGSHPYCPASSGMSGTRC